MPSPRPHPPRQHPLGLLLQASLRQARRIAVVGIGSDLRGDDVAGILVIRELKAALTRAKASIIRIFDGGTAPENLTGEIVRWQPSHILLVDAADLGQKPGTVKLIASEAVGGMSFSTHVLPLSILADYLKRALPCRIIIIGIQPGNTDFGKAPARVIQATARRLARAILKAAPIRNSQRGQGQTQGAVGGH